MGYWYMLFLWQCYLFTHIYNLLCPISQDKKTRYICDAAWVLVIVAGLVIFDRTADVDARSIVGAGWLCRFYPFFFVGYVLHRDDIFLHLLDNRQRLFDLAGVAFIPFMALVLSAYGNHFIVHESAAPFAVYVIVWVFYRYRNTSHGAKSLLETMGRHSLSIYLFHYFFLWSVDLTAIGHQFVVNNPLFTALIGIVLALLISIVCVAISWLVRQNNILSFLLLGALKASPQPSPEGKGSLTPTLP